MRVRTSLITTAADDNADIATDADDDANDDADTAEKAAGVVDEERKSGDK